MIKPSAPLPPKPDRVANPAPPGACDTHVHILAGPDELPLNPDRTEDPAASFTEYLSGYRAHLAALGIAKGVIVQSIFYGTDNTVTVDAIRKMGDGFCGIGLLTDAADERLLDQFVEWRLRGVRLNHVHGGVLTWDGAKRLAPKLAERGLHIQILLHADRHMETLADDIAACPVPVVIDHVGWPTDMVGGTQTPGFRTLRRLLADGHAYVKLSGLYRLADAPYERTDDLVAALVAANPDRCVWGSDWPHIMLNGAQMPTMGDLWDAFHRAVPDEETRRKILVDTPATLYRI